MKKRNILFIHLLLLSTLLAAQQPQSYISQLWGEGKWSATWETQLKYDANQYLVSDTTQFWDESQNDWIFTARTFYLNDSIGTLVNRKGESWNVSQNIWVDANQSLYVQDSNGNIIEEITMHKQQNIWENVYKITSRYDTNNFKNYELEQRWNMGNGVWRNRLLDSLILNSNGSIKESFTWQGDEFTNLWEGPSRATHTYNQAGDIKNSIYQDSKNGVWDAASFREDWTYDQNGNLTLMQMKVRHPDSSAWINFQQDIYLNTTIGLLKEKTTQVWIDSTAQWVNSQRLIYSYNNTVGLDDQEELVFDFFPNPSDNFLNIKLENESKANVEITDMQGRSAQFLEILEGKGTFDISNLPPNMYLLKIIQEDKISVKRFIKH